MPTPESADAFAKLVAARTRLTEITKELNEASIQMHASNGGRQRYLDLQKVWEEAFENFETATNEFSAVVHGMKPHLDSEQD